MRASAMHLILVIAGLLAATTTALPTGSSKRTELNPPPWRRDAVFEPTWPHKDADTKDIWERDETTLNPPPWRRNEPVDFYNPPAPSSDRHYDEQNDDLEKRRIPSAIPISNYNSDSKPDSRNNFIPDRSSSSHHHPWTRDVTPKHDGDSSGKTKPQSLELLNWDIVDPNDKSKGITGKPLELHAWDIVDHGGAFKDSFLKGSSGAAAGNGNGNGNAGKKGGSWQNKRF